MNNSLFGYGEVLKYSLAVAAGVGFACVDIVLLIPYITTLLILSIAEDLHSFRIVNALYEMKKNNKITTYKKDESSSDRLLAKQQEKELAELKSLRNNITETLKIKAWGYSIILLILLGFAFYQFEWYEYLSNMSGGSNFINLESRK